MNRLDGGRRPMASLITATLLVALACFDVSNSLAQVASVETAADAQPSLPDGFFPKYADKQTYASEKVLRLSNNPGYFADKPDQIAEALAYFEFMIDRITRTNNVQIGPKERQQYLDLRANLRSKIGIDANASPSAAIATLYTVSRIDSETLKQGVATGDIGAFLDKQGFTAAQVSSLTEVFEAAGFDEGNIFSVGDAVSQIVSVSGLDAGIANAIVDALGLDASDSFADAVAAFNATFGTSFSVDQAKEALGLGQEQEAGN